MKTLILAKPWSYITPSVTIDYPAGDHEVTDQIHAAAVKAGATPGETDGNGPAKAGAARAADKA